MKLSFRGPKSWKQCLINRDRHHHVTSKGMDNYDRLSVIWKSDLTDKIKRQFLPSSGRVDTAIYMHYMGANKTYGEKN